MNAILFNSWVLFILFIIWFIGIINAINLIDGLDGLASGYMIIYCISFLFIEKNLLFLEANIFLIISLLLNLTVIGKDKIINEEDKILLYNLYKKLVQEFKEIENR